MTYWIPPAIVDSVWWIKPDGVDGQISPQWPIYFPFSENSLSSCSVLLCISIYVNVQDSCCFKETHLQLTILPVFCLLIYEYILMKHELLHVTCSSLTQMLSGCFTNDCNFCILSSTRKSYQKLIPYFNFDYYKLGVEWGLHWLENMLNLSFAYCCKYLPLDMKPNWDTSLGIFPLFCCDIGQTMMCLFGLP